MDLTGIDHQKISIKMKVQINSLYRYNVCPDGIPHCRQKKQNFVIRGT